MLAFSIPLQHLCIFMLLQPAPTHAVRKQRWPFHLEPQHYTIPVCLLLFSRWHPPGILVSLFFISPFCFCFLFLAGEPVPVGFKPIRWLRPQPIPIPVVQKVFPPGQPYSMLPQPLVSDGAAGLDNHLMASHHGLLSWYFLSGCELTSGPGLFACRSY